MSARLARFALLLAAAALLVVQAGHYEGTWTDDAYITFRYARNIADGVGPVFNAGEPLEGITNLGWALLLAPFARFDLLVVARVANLACAVLTTALLARWARREGLGLVATAITLAAFALPAWVPTWTMQGLEAPAVMLVVTAAWTRYLDEVRAPRGPLLAGAAMGLGPWLRPTAAVVPLLLGAWHVWRGRIDRRRTLVNVAITVVFAALLVGVKLAWYGEILPNTFYVKADQVASQRGFVYLGSFLTRPSPWLPALLVVAIARALAWARGKDDRAVPGLVFAGWLGAAVFENGDFMANFRLLVPGWPAAAAALGLLVQDLVARAPNRLGAPALARVAALAMVAGSLVAPARAFWLDELNRAGDATHPSMFPAEKSAPFLQPWRSPRWGTGLVDQLSYPTAWALVNAGPDATIAYTELGLFSYVHEGPVLDLLGLADRVMAGRNHETLDEKWAYVAGRASWVVVSVRNGTWPWVEPHLAAERWTVVDGCGSNWIFANPARPGSRPDAAELDRRLDLAVRRAPLQRTLQLGIGRELAHAGADPVVIGRFLDAAGASGAPVTTTYRCSIGLGDGCTSQDTCESGVERVKAITYADPARWPEAPDEVKPPAPPEPPVGAGGPAGPVAPPVPVDRPPEACLDARERAARAWDDVAAALRGVPGSDDARRFAREAATATRLGGADAPSLIREAGEATARVGAGTAASDAAKAASEAAAAACP